MDSVHTDLLPDGGGGGGGGEKKGEHTNTNDRYEEDDPTIMLIDTNNCSICLDTISESDLQRTEQCQHTFHRQCINRWLETHNTCPECRVVLFSVEQLAIPPGRDDDEYLCICRGIYCCYFPHAMRGCTSLMYFMLGLLMMYVFVKNIYYFKPPVNIWFIVSTVISGILLIVNTVLYIMLKLNIQCRDMRFTRFNHEFELPI